MQAYDRYIFYEDQICGNLCGERHQASPCRDVERRGSVPSRSSQQQSRRRPAGTSKPRLSDWERAGLPDESAVSAPNELTAGRRRLTDRIEHDVDAPTLCDPQDLLLPALLGVVHAKVRATALSADLELVGARGRGDDLSRPEPVSHSHITT